MATPPNSPLAFNINPNEVAAVNPSNISPVYANNASIMQTQHDFRIVFTEVVTEGPATPPRLELRASVGLSPTMLKATYHAIGATLQNYEAQNGEIKWPPQQPKIS